MPMTPMSKIESVDAKIQRAKHHLSDLSLALGELGRNHTPEMILKENGRDVWLVVYYPEPHAPFSQSAVFGDFLYNLRSSLDALIYALCRAEPWSSNARHLISHLFGSGRIRAAHPAEQEDGCARGTARRGPCAGQEPPTFHEGKPKPGS